MTEVELLTRILEAESSTASAAWAAAWGVWLCAGICLFRIWCLGKNQRTLF